MNIKTKYNTKEINITYLSKEEEARIKEIKKGIKELEKSLKEVIKRNKRERILWVLED